MSMPSLLVIAKAPFPGRSKTRLTPPLRRSEAALMAEAALADTLEAVARVPARRRTLVLDGAAGPWLPVGFEVVAQRTGGLDERIAGAFTDGGAPALLIGMDTPQVTPSLLGRCLRRLSLPDVDAVLGPANDGGYWALGLKRADIRTTLGVPMSSPDTFEQQMGRLRALGLRTALLPPLCDVDTIDDARAVAAAAPWSRFARTLHGLQAPGGRAQIA